MRIIVIRSNPVNPDSRVEKEVNALLKANHKVEIIGWDRNAKYAKKKSVIKFETGQANIYRFGIPSSYGGGMKRNLKGLMIFQLNILIWLVKNRKNYDVIHACDFDTAFMAKKIAKLFNKKLVYDIFDYYIDSFNVPSFLKKIVEKEDWKIINFADSTIICSEKRMEQIKGASPKKVSVIHNTPQKIPDIFNVKDDLTNKIKLVYVGILGEGRLIKEIIDVVKSNSQYELHIGGFGELENYIKEQSIYYENILFYGKLPYHKTLQLEAKSDIMLAIYDPNIANHHYAAPNKFYEALMLGKPLIMVRGTGMSEIVSEFNIGELMDFNSKSFKESLDKLISRKREWDEMSNKMKLMYENKYNWTEMEYRLINLYDEL